jgi:hypothetical protein
MDRKEGVGHRRGRERSSSKKVIKKIRGKTRETVGWKGRGSEYEDRKRKKKRDLHPRKKRPGNPIHRQRIMTGRY